MHEFGIPNRAPLRTPIKGLDQVAAHVPKTPPNGTRRANYTQHPKRIKPPYLKQAQNRFFSDDLRTLANLTRPKPPFFRKNQPFRHQNTLYYIIERFKHPVKRFVQSQGFGNPSHSNAQASIDEKLLNSSRFQSFRISLVTISFRRISPYVDKKLSKTMSFPLANSR